MACQRRTEPDTRVKNLLTRLAMTLALIALLAVLSFAAYREAVAEAPTEVLRVATDASYWPMEYMSGTQIVGYDIDLMNAVAAHLGVAVVYTHVPWNDIFDDLAAGQYDAIISTVSVSPDREQSMDFTLPYVTFGASENIAIAVQQGNDPLRLQMNEALRALRAAGALETIIAGISSDAPQWQPRLPAWPYIYLPIVIRN
jgi:ABC-type amino acid transport substrate-binding protein